ncbi:MAG TPA: hypothetical protein PLD54_03540 [Candidatus Levybacteria bacterium]|nr:hypothetical protein [Candidatus Levybacteria bacterium]
MDNLTLHIKSHTLNRVDMYRSKKFIVLAIVNLLLIGGIALLLFYIQKSNSVTLVTEEIKDDTTHIVKTPSEPTSSEITISNGSFDRTKSTFASQIGTPLRLQFMNLDPTDYNVIITSQPEHSSITDSIEVNARKLTEFELHIPGIYEITLNGSSMKIEYLQ